ncbi:uncharacterized protein BDV17DRAFT_108196 [Aspergillus undulatus]|uniref:uncharacterized protein n=1 Tax=Aspergillus undulatus TaxID=1810928 RepID=UPI003CCC9755
MAPSDVQSPDSHDAIGLPADSGQRSQVIPIHHEERGSSWAHFVITLCNFSGCLCLCLHWRHRTRVPRESRFSSSHPAAEPCSNHRRRSSYLFLIKCQLSGAASKGPGLLSSPSFGSSDMAPIQAIFLKKVCPRGDSFESIA